MKKLIYLSLLSSLTLAACQNDQNPNESGQEENSQVEDSQEEMNQDQGSQTEDSGADQEDEEGEEGQADGDQGQLEVTDPLDHQVSLPSDPERLAVFDNGQLDILQDLGLADRVVATATDNLPDHLQEFADLPVAGTLHEIDLEIANAEEPDLAIVARRSSDNYDAVSQVAPTLDMSDADGDLWASIQENLSLYGEIFNLEDEASAIESDLEASLSDLQEQNEASDLSTLVLMTNEGALSAFGSGSRYSFVHDLFGFEPVDTGIEASRHGMDVSYEYVVDQNPDLIFVIDRTAAIGGDQEAGEFSDNPLIQETDAYQNDNIVYLTPDVWYLSEGGTQALAQMIEEVSVVFD